MIVKFFLFVLIYFASFDVQAKLQIEIIKGTEKLPNIAVVPFMNIENNKFNFQIRDLVNEKLNLFGEFESLPSEKMLSFPTKEEDFFFRDWKLLSSDYVIFGNITSLENTININYFVSDVNLERIVLNGDVNGSKDEIELITFIGQTIGSE